MQITKRDFLKKLGLVSAVGATGTMFGDEYVPDNSKILPGSVGNPMRPGWANLMFPLPHTVTDGPSRFLKDGTV